MRLVWNGALDFLAVGVEQFAGMEERMERWLIAVRANCDDPSREEELNGWYDDVHVPDVLKIPGMMLQSL